MASHAPQSARAAPGKATVAPRPARAPEQPKPERTTMPPLASDVPLAGDLRRYFTPRLGGLGNVTVATADPAVAAAGAKAVTLGQRIAFAPGRYRPDTEAGRTLIAHELIHTRQQNSGAPDRARASEHEAALLAPQLAAGAKVSPQVTTCFATAADVEDYQVSMPEEDMQAQIDALGFSKLDSDIAAINEFEARQIQTSPELIQMLERRTQLVARRDALVRAAHTDPPKPKRGKAKPKAKAKNSSEPVYAAPTSPDAPRILREQRSMPTTDPDEVKQEVDRIVMWLQRSDVSPGDKSILRGELASLAPGFEQAQAADSQKRQADRVQRAFNPPVESADPLRHVVATVVGISHDPADPEAAYIYHENERIRISKAQAEHLRTTVAAQLRTILDKAGNTMSMAWSLYRMQKDIDADHPIVSRLSGLLGGVSDPSSAMTRASNMVNGGLYDGKNALNAGDLMAAVEPVSTAAINAQKVHAAVHGWQDGLISGAETAVTGLTFIRDASAVIVGAIAVVVAAPFAAGFVAATGATGLTASGLTIATTGVMAGTGVGLTFGGAEVVGQLGAGADAETAFGEGRKVFKQRFIETAPGAIGGGVTKGVTKLIGPGKNIVTKLGSNVVAGGAGNFAGTTSGALMQGDDLSTAAGKGGRSAVIGGIGSLAGAPFAKMPKLQLGATAGTGAVLNYADARSQGASQADAMRSASMGLVTSMVMRPTPGMQKDLQRYEAKGQQLGQSARKTAGNVAKTTRAYAGAAMIGLGSADPVFSGGGGRSATTLTDRRQAGYFSRGASDSEASKAAASKPTAKATAPAVQQTNAESEMGIAPAQRAAIKANFGTPISTASGGILGQIWQKVANPGQAANLTLANSRNLFRNHRNRFWRAVRADPQARQLIADMGGTFPAGPTTAPVITLPNGTRMQITIDHIVERQSAPGQALNPANLRLSSRLENTVGLRQLHGQDPFQNPTSHGWVPF